MRKLINRAREMVRLWPDATTTGVTDFFLGLIYEESIVLSAERCDTYYNKWAASDSPDSFFTYVRTWETNGRMHGIVPLTDEDQAIMARQWMHSSTPPIALIEGDQHDIEIFALLAECAAANGGKTTDRDHAYIEEATYIYWGEQCGPDFEFDPIIIS